MVTLGIAEDHDVMRRTLCFLFSKMKDCSVIMNTQNGFELLTQLQKAEERPSVVFLDVNMPVMDGVSTAFFIRTHYPKIHVIALSYYCHYLVVQDMFDAGATGYILKDNITETLLSSVVTSVLSGSPYVDPSIELRNFISIPERISISESAHSEITRKEKTYLQLCATNISNGQIAELMNVATDSIYNYQKSLKSKLGLSTRLELALYAINHDITRVARYKTLKSSALQRNNI